MHAKDKGRHRTNENFCKACKAYFAEKGSWPTQKSGPSFKWTGLRLSWDRIDDLLRSRGSSLPKFLIEQGLKMDTLTPKDLSDEELLTACVAYHAETGRWPHGNSGDSFKWTGVHITWAGIEYRLRTKGSSLTKFLIPRGRKAYSPKDAPKKLTDAELLAACKAYHADTGKWPSVNSGSSIKWTKRRRLWSGIDYDLWARGSSLAKFLIEHGLKEATSSEEILDDALIAACTAHFAEKGKWPTGASGDSFKWTGRHITWSGIDSRLKTRGSSLSKFLIKHGVKEPRLKGAIPHAKILAACKVYHAETGRWPAASSGDSFKWTGVHIQWGGISQRLVHKGSNLKVLRHTA